MISLYHFTLRIINTFVQNAEFIFKVAGIYNYHFYNIYNYEVLYVVGVLCNSKFDLYL